mgnify:FL=1
MMLPLLMSLTRWCRFFPSETSPSSSSSSWYVSGQASASSCANAPPVSGATRCVATSDGNVAAVFNLVTDFSIASNPETASDTAPTWQYGSAPPYYFSRDRNASTRQAAAARFVVAGTKFQDDTFVGWRDADTMATIAWRRDVDRSQTPTQGHTAALVQFAPGCAELPRGIPVARLVIPAAAAAPTNAAAAPLWKVRVDGVVFRAPNADRQFYVTVAGEVLTHLNAATNPTFDEVVYVNATDGIIIDVAVMLSTGNCRDGTNPVNVTVIVEMYPPPGRPTATTEPMGRCPFNAPRCALLDGVAHAVYDLGRDFSLSGNPAVFASTPEGPSMSPWTYGMSDHLDFRAFRVVDVVSIAGSKAGASHPRRPPS